MRKKSIKNFPPSWCPDALPSERGWVHPKTGELLVSVKGGCQPIQEQETEKVVVEVNNEEKQLDEIVGSKDVSVVKRKRRTKNVV